MALLSIEFHPIFYNPNQDPSESQNPLDLTLTVDPIKLLFLLEGGCVQVDITSFPQQHIEKSVTKIFDDSLRQMLVGLVLIQEIVDQNSVCFRDRLGYFFDRLRTHQPSASGATTIPEQPKGGNQCISTLQQIFY
jgi:hypothetical protein